MARQFKPVRFFVLMGVAAFTVSGVAVFYTHRGAHGKTAEESRQKAEEVPRRALAHLNPDTAKEVLSASQERL
jgi:hypothetical protein